MHSRLVAGGSLLLPYCRTAGAISIRRNIVHIDQEYPTRMYENRYVREHQRKRDETLPKDFYKKSTGLCGLYVSMQPHKELTEVLTRILHVLKLMPEDYEYRLNTEEIVQQRLSHTKNEPVVRKLEEKIGMGQVEELIEQATYELETARMLAYYKAWEPLVEQAEESQWRWPIGSGP